MIFFCFQPVLELMLDSLTSHIDAFHINSFYSTKDQSLKFLRKNIENWRSWKMTFCFVFCFCFLLLVFLKIYFSQFTSPWLSHEAAFISALFFRILKKALSQLICTSFHVQHDQKILDGIYCTIVIHSIICGCNTLFYRSHILLNSLLENWSEEQKQLCSVQSHFTLDLKEDIFYKRVYYFIKCTGSKI